LKFVKHNNFSETDDESFLRFVKIWFSSARKKLIKNFANAWLDKNKILDIFNKLDINENIRWEAIWIEKWCELVGELNKI
jgi:16S rRNA A1518/A1519 N6-dimethyltransferase RsmA/KsgA/DIM1 with predicted DNA glycosylase/AP lyase activity